MAAVPEALNVSPAPTAETFASPRPFDSRRKTVAAIHADEVDESLYLLGRPRLKQFLRFVRDNAIEPPAEDALVGEWQAAKDRIAALEQAEAGCADNPVITKIAANSKYEPLLIEFLKDPLVQNGFNTVPTEVAFVELDGLVVYQKHIDLTFVRQLQNRLGARPSAADVFRTCLPYDHPQPPAKWSRLDDESYIFVSPSNDLRFLGAMPLKRGHIEGYPHPGELVGVVGLAVGFGSNFLNAIYCENRLILNNGSHRAYALREMGFTHVPCIVQHPATREELEMVASSEVRRDPDLYLRRPRPSMLKDYFNPKLRRVMPAHRQLRQVKVRFSVSEYFVPAL